MSYVCLSIWILYILRWVTHLNLQDIIFVNFFKPVNVEIQISREYCNQGIFRLSKTDLQRVVNNLKRNKFSMSNDLASPPSTLSCQQVVFLYLSSCVSPVELKGTIRPDRMCMRVVSLESTLKDMNRYIAICS
jgi:hypothetical protein